VFRVKEMVVKNETTYIPPHFNMWRTALMKQVEAAKGEAKENLAPIPFITQITPSGLITVTFSQEMIQLPNLTYCTNATFEEEDIIYPVMEVNILEGRSSALEDLGYFWNVTEQGKTYIKIQMYFDNPIAVSSHPQEDWVQVRFIDPYLFVSKDL